MDHVLADETLARPSARAGAFESCRNEPGGFPTSCAAFTPGRHRRDIKRRALHLLCSRSGTLSWRRRMRRRFRSDTEPYADTDAYADTNPHSDADPRADIRSIDRNGLEHDRSANRRRHGGGTGWS